MDKLRTLRGSHWTIDHLPNNGKKTFRVRWKNIRSLGNPTDPDFHKVHYFETQKQAKQFATNKIEETQHLGKLADALGVDDKAKILREAARLAERGIDPLQAMNEGAQHLIACGEHAETKIGEFWPDYVAHKKANGKWGSRNARAQEAFFQETKESFMQIPIKKLVSVKSGKAVIREALEKYRSRSERNAENTLKGAKSRMRTFLTFVANEIEALDQETLSAIFSKEANEYLMPTGLRKEAKNVAIRTDEARYLLGFMASRKLAGWIVFKLFMGARTMLVQQWKWSIVDWDKGLITIPRDQTKLKKSDISFNISEIPHFLDWLKWAWEIDGRPSPEDPIARFSQPTITNLVKQAINEKKELFTSDKRKSIKPGESMRNFMRSGFITYGSQIPELGVGKIMKIAEDAHNLDKYLAWDSAKGPQPEAEAFWSLTPDKIIVATFEPRKSKAGSLSKRKTSARPQAVA